MRILIFVILVLFYSGCSSKQPSNSRSSRPYDFLNQSIKTFKGHTGSVNAIAITPNGKYAISGSDDKTLKLWDINSGKNIRTFKGHTGSVNTIAITPNGKYAISGSDDKTLKLWDINSGKNIRTFKGHTSYVSAIAITPNGKYAISGGYKTLKLWDINSGKNIRTFKGHTGSVDAIAITPNGKYAISGDWDETLKLWDINSGKNIRTFKGHRYSVHAIAITPNGKYAISGGYRTLKLWDINSGKNIRTFKGHTSDVNAIAITPNGKYAISGSRDDTLKLWDINSGKNIRTFKGHRYSVHAIAITPNGKYAISRSCNRTLKLWDINSGKDIKPFEDHTYSTIDIQYFLNFISSNGYEELPSCTYSKKPFQLIEKITQKITNLYLQPKEITPPPKIAKPTLPPQPKLKKSEYETKAMFQKRVNKTIAKREAKVKALQKQYRIDVENRNKKIEAIRKRYLKEQAYKKFHIKEKIIQFQKDAFKAVMGYFTLEKRSYDAENEILYATIKASRANYSKKISLKVPLNKAKTFVNNIRSIKVDAKFEFTGSQIILKSIDAIHQGQTYVALLNAKDFKPQNMEVAIKDKKVEFDSAKQMRLTLQNPNLKDTYQIEALAYSDGKEVTGINYQDDIPQFLQSANQTQKDPKKWLFVIGAEKYDNTDDVTYSKRSAETFVKVAQKSLGITNRNSYALIGDGATSGAIEDKLKLMLRNIKEGDSIYFFYSGHGIPVLPNRVPYILPKDKVPDFIKHSSFFKLDSIYNLLSNSKASKIIAIMDSCFSGSTDGQSVFKGVAGSVLIPKKVTFNHNKMVVLTAGRDKQFSNMYPQKGHRLFSYFVMKSLLEGKRSVRDVYNDVYPKVKSTSNGFGDLKRQEPTIEGNEGLRF